MGVSIDRKEFAHSPYDGNYAQTAKTTEELFVRDESGTSSTFHNCTQVWNLEFKIALSAHKRLSSITAQGLFDQP